MSGLSLAPGSNEKCYVDNQTTHAPGKAFMSPHLPDKKVDVYQEAEKGMRESFVEFCKRKSFWTVTKKLSGQPLALAGGREGGKVLLVRPK